MQKLFGGGGPLIEVETQGACSSQCCEEVVSESSDSPTTTHPSRHANSSFGTIPPDIESIPCESGILDKWSAFPEGKSIILNLLKQSKNKLTQKAGCMWMQPDLYVAGIQYGWRRLRGIWGSTREKFCVGETNSPLSALRRGAHNASTSWKGQCEDRHKSDNNRCIQHLSIVAAHFWNVSTIYQMCRSTPIQLVCRCSNVGLFVSV